MEIKIAALLTASAFATIAFVGCSCARSVNNDTDENLNKIAIESGVTVSSDTSATTTSRTVYTETSLSTTATETSNTSGTQTSKSVPVQFVGNPNARVTTARHIATQVVVVTVTLSPQTTEETTTEAITTTTVTAAVTQNAPDGVFTPANDMIFTLDSIQLKVGDNQPYLGSYAREVSDGTIVHGGTAAYIYSFDGFRVATENMTKPDGSTGEFITEIVLTGDDVRTNKGIKKGSTIDDIYAAYGTSQCLNEETNIYRYKTDDGFVLEFCTDGSIVTEIKYYMAVE